MSGLEVGTTSICNSFEHHFLSAFFEHLCDRATFAVTVGGDVRRDDLHKPQLPSLLVIDWDL